ncbi:MAG: hypothetical protein AAGF95_13220 [Chloroflexota bacterium]
MTRGAADASPEPVEGNVAQRTTHAKTTSPYSIRFAIYCTMGGRIKPITSKEKRSVKR